MNENEAITAAAGTIQFAPPFEGALKKSECDNFHYLLKTKTGDLICFESSRLFFEDGIAWRALTGIRVNESDFQNMTSGRFRFERGIDVRESEIEWIADAPSGS
jgi:hypothetical protein